MSWNVEIPEAECYLPGDRRIESVVREIQASKLASLDTETTGLDVCRSMPVFWSLAVNDRRICMPIETLPAFREVFSDSSINWVLHNAKFDAHMLANVGVTLRGNWYDTSVMHALLYEGESHALKYVAKKMLGWKWSSFKETFGIADESRTGEVLLETWNLDRQRVVEYAANDAYGTLKLYWLLRGELEREKIFSLYPDLYPTMWDLYQKTELPFTKVLWVCERNGIKVNTDYLASVDGPVSRELVDIEKEMFRILQRPFNPRSTPQVRSLVLDDLKLRPRRMTSGGKSGVRSPSVDAEFLEECSDIPIIGLILRYRDLDKLLGTYVRGLHEKLGPDGRIHARFNQDVARTGRLSSSEPNMQNIPNADNDRHKIRRAFVAEPGNSLIVADYSALEMRLLASAAGEPDMIQIFLDGKDIHMGNASLVFGLPYEDIVKAKKLDKAIKEAEEKVKKGEPDTELKRLEKEMEGYYHDCLLARGYAKTIGFGLNYGMKANKLARGIGKSVEEAELLMEQYMARYPAVRQFYDEAIQETTLSLKSYTILGRRRFLPEITSNNNLDRWGAERQAVNNQIQGSAADLVRMAMLAANQSDLVDQHDCHMLLQVHDELVFECPEGEVDICKKKIQAIMEHPFPTELKVPFEVSIGHGSNWLDAK